MGAAADFPRPAAPDTTLGLLRENYDFIGNRCRQLGSDAFRTRLTLRRRAERWGPGPGPGGARSRAAVERERLAYRLAWHRDEEGRCCQRSMRRWSC